MNPFSGLQPVSVPFSGNADASGSFTFTTRPRPAFWVHLKMAGQVSAGTPTWTVSTGAGPIGFGRGPRAEVAPILLAPGDLVTIALVGATPNAVVTGQLVGAQAPTAEEAMAYNPAVSTIALDVTAPRQQLWPDGTTPANKKGPSFTVAATVVTSFRITLPSGTTAIRVGPTLTGGGSFVFSYQLRVTGHQSGIAYFPAPFAGIGTPTFPRQPVTVPIDPEYDTQIDIGITGDVSNSLDFYVSALGAVEAIEVYAQQPFGVTSNVSGVTPAPWQVPNIGGSLGVATIGAGGSVVIIPAGGATVDTRLFRVTFTVDAVAATFGLIECPAGTARAAWDGTISRNYDFDFGGLDCGFAAGVVIHNTSAAGTGNINGMATANQT